MLQFSARRRGSFRCENRDRTPIISNKYSESKKMYHQPGKWIRSSSFWQFSYYPPSDRLPPTRNGSIFNSPGFQPGVPRRPHSLTTPKVLNNVARNKNSSPPFVSFARFVVKNTPTPKSGSPPTPTSLRLRGFALRDLRQGLRVKVFRRMSN
jgi:hypothetical protein